MKRLCRSETQRVIAGVCGGVGTYFGIDPVLVRLAWVFATLMGGAGILAYILAMIVIPSERRARMREGAPPPPPQPPPPQEPPPSSTGGPMPPPAGEDSPPASFSRAASAGWTREGEAPSRARMLAGIILLVAGFVWVTGSLPLPRLDFLNLEIWNDLPWRGFWSREPLGLSLIPAVVAVLFIVTGLYLIFLYARQARDDLWNPRWIRRSREDRRIAGVCGGIARHFQLDPTLVRLGWIFGTIFAHVGVLLYLVLAIVLPLAPDAAAAPTRSSEEGHRNDA